MTTRFKETPFFLLFLACLFPFLPLSFVSTLLLHLYHLIPLLREGLTDVLALTEQQSAKKWEKKKREENRWKLDNSLL